MFNTLSAPAIKLLPLRQPDVKDWSWLGVLVVLWGSAFALISVSLKDFTPLQVVNARLWIGALVLLMLMKGRGQETPRDGKTWSFFLAMAVLGNALPFFLISWGQQEVASGVTGILMAIMPLIVLPLAHFLVPDEGMTVTRLIGFTLGFVGIVFLTGPEVLREFNGQGTALWSQIAILSGAVCYAFNLIIARKAPHHEPLVTAAWVLVLSACLSSVALWIDGDILPERPSLTPTIALVTLGILSTGIATEVYFRVVTRAGATFLSLINYLIPIFAVLVGAVFLGEHIPVRSLIALVIILAGVVISQRSKPATRGTEG